MPKWDVAQTKLLLGIDGGGSKCRAVIATQDLEILGQAVSGPANPFQGLAQAIESILTATQLALAEAHLDPQAVRELVAGVGLAGVNLPSVYRKMEQWPHPFAQMALTTDLEIASLGAHGGSDGGVIVAGTGSSGWARVQGKTTIIGAHGFPFGDVGGGAWLGLQALQAVLLADDNLGPSTLLGDLIPRELGVPIPGIPEKMTGAGPASLASLAPHVFQAAEADDAVAVDIVQRGADYLALVARNLRNSGAPATSMVGGLSELYRPWLPAELLDQLSPALASPSIGALHYARNQASTLPG